MLRPMARRTKSTSRFDTIGCWPSSKSAEDKAVTWTKPDDLPFDPDQPLAALGTIPEEGFYAVGMGLVPTHIQRNVSGDAFRRLVEGDPPPEPQDPESLRQQGLIDKYKKLGASVERRHRRDDQTMISLALEGEKITDGDLKDLAKFKNLFGLSLRGTKVTDAGLKDVGAIQTLTNLTLLFSPNTTAAGMKEIAGLKRLDEFVYRVRESGRRGLEGVRKNHDIEIARYRKNRGDRCRTRTACSAHEARIS